MAQEIRIVRRDGGRAERRPDGYEHGSTEEARRAIEATRGRISATLDEIEDRIDQTREQIKERVNVVRPVQEQIRTHPLPALGIALGTGLALGLLSGGGRKERGMLDEDEREERRKWRKERRERLRERFGERARTAEQGPSLLGQVGGALLSAAMAGVAARAQRAIMGDRPPERV